jgi:tripartite-type tricarboxylate transporter receptor subunit TctC
MVGDRQCWANIWRVMKLRSLVLASFVCLSPAVSEAQNWPGTKPLKLESGSAPGGITDLVARELSNYLATSLGVPVVVEDRPGGGGNIAAAVVARAQPDGHTLLVTGSNQVVNPTLLPAPGLDYDRDFVPVSMVAVTKLLLVAAPAFPATSITDVISIAKQQPKSVSIGFSVIGTPSHLAAEMLAQSGDVDLTFVPYDGGAQAIPDVIANRVNLEISATSTLLPQVRGGALKALAVLAPQRSPFAPEIPTAVESGLPELQIDSWICIMGTGGTPAPIIARLDAAITDALAAPELRDGFAKQGVEILRMDSQQLGKFLQSEASRFNGLLEHSRVVGAAR